MACDGNDYVTNFRDGILILEDGAGHTLEVPLEMGDVSITGLNAIQAERVVYRSRGRTKSVRRGVDQEISISFSAMLNRLGSTATKTNAAGKVVPSKPALIDFILFRGAFAGNVGTTHVCGDAKLLTARWQLTVPEGTDYIELHGVGFDLDTAEGDPNTVSASGTVYDPDVVIVRAA